MQRVLILGSSGFIGRNLVDKLHKRYKLLTPSHNDLDLTNQNTVSSYFRTQKIDIVVNAVVVGGSRKEEHEENALKNNLLMFFNIVKNKQKFKKLIHFGSGAEYDKSRPLKKVKEKDFGKKIPTDDYGFFKYTCSKYIETADNIINLRIFGLFGKYEDYRYRFISNAICLNLLGRPLTMNQNVYFDYMYIDDFIKIVEHFMNYNGKHRFYNIGTGKKIDILSIAKKINHISDKKSQIIIKKPGLNNEYTCNNARLMQELRNSRFTPFDDSLYTLYNWYKQNISTIKLEK